MSQKILLIEDMQGVRDSLEMILSMANYEVDTAENGEEGLIKAGSRDYDLIITDILMPKTDGIDVILTLEKKGIKIPILAISAGGNGVSASDALTVAAQKATAILEKPFSKEELLTKVKTLLSA